MKNKLKILAILVILNSSFLILNCFGQWSSDTRLTFFPDTSITSSNSSRHITSDGNNVHAVWKDKRDGTSAIYYKKSTNNGLNWGSDIKLTYVPNNTGVGYCGIAVNGDNLHVVWADNRTGAYQIFYTRSTDGGEFWDWSLLSTNSSKSNNCPSITASGSNLYVTWHILHDNNNPEIMFKRSTNNGLTWGPDTRLTNADSSSIWPSIAVSGSNIHITWWDKRDNDYEIYYKRSSDGGFTWGPDTRLTFDANVSRAPCIDASGPNVHIVWYENATLISNKIYYMRSTNGGITWGNKINLITSSQSMYPSIAASGLNLHLVWEDALDGNWEIYYKNSTDGGTTWGPDIRLTNDENLSCYSSICFSGSYLHILWTDDRDGNQEIYYKQNPAGNTIGIKNISNEIPSEFKLEQNYPNPFNPVTKIQFDIAQHTPYPLSRGEFTTLKIFDILGKEVATIVNEVLQPGSYEVTFNAGNLASGIYFYRLTVRHGVSSTGDYIKTKKMLMIK